ncbi:MAG: hypothetical protein RLN99_10365 [Kiloniellaceae bacterium]
MSRLPVSETSPRFVSDPGANLLTVAALAGAVVAAVAYFDRGSGIDGTPGALLVIASSTAICLAGLVVIAAALRRGLFHAILVVLLLLGILGTALAAAMLHSTLLLAMMGLCLLGWLAHLFTRKGSRPAAAAEGAAR